MKLIDDELREAICGQIGHEIYNSHVYLYFAGDLKNRGFDNLANIFMEQYEEEQKHMKMLFELLTNLNIHVAMPQIDECDMPINSIFEIAQAYVDREILTTESLNEIKLMAMDNKNPIVEEKFREMISLQEKEMEESTSFMDSALIFKEWWQVALWDKALKR